MYKLALWHGHNLHLNICCWIRLASLQIHDRLPLSYVFVLNDSYSKRSCRQMRPLGKLKDIQVRTLGPGAHGDGGGLQLSVKQGVTGIHRSWVFRYSFAGRAHLMGLGPYPDISLQRARQKALECRQQLHDGIDPLAHKRNQRASVAREAAQQSVPSFEECRDAYVASHRAGWRNVRHSHDWVRSLHTHVTPIFGSTPVDMIDTALVCKALEPIWRT